MQYLVKQHHDINGEHHILHKCTKVESPPEASTVDHINAHVYCLFRARVSASD
jgi:hypothetical protein